MNEQLSILTRDKNIPMIKKESPPQVLDRILLIEPQNGYYTGFQGLVLTEPLGLEFVAGGISDIVGEVRIHDDRIKPDGWRQTITEFPPDLIGIRCNYTADVPTVRNLVRQIRQEVGKDVPIVIGGHHISLRPSDVFIPEVSAVAIGPGEQTFRRLVIDWSKKHTLENVPGIWYQDKEGVFQSNVETRLISPHFQYQSPEMNERPLPRRDLVTEFRDDYYFLYYPGPYSVETARGCRFRCTFCSVWNFHGGEYQVESPNRTVQEIATLPANAKYVNIVDDLAFSDIDGAEDLANELLRLGVNKRYWAQIRADNVWPKDPAKREKHLRVFERLADAGLDMVLIGLESFDPKELKRVNKGSTVEQNIEAINFLRDHGIKIWGAQIIFPDWDVSDFDKAIEINQRLGIEAPQFTILAPLPGTPDYDNAVKNGLLTTQDPGKFDFFHWVVPTKLPADEMYRQISRLYRETSPMATGLDGRPISYNQAKRQYRKVAIDIVQGRTTRAAFEAFAERFKGLRTPEIHLQHLAQSAIDMADVEENIVWQNQGNGN